MTTAQMKTLRVRVKDKHSALLRRMACNVNTTWNFCNETALKALRDRNQWLSGYELQKLVSGYSKCDGVEIVMDTAHKVCDEFAQRRRQFRKSRLAWRVSNPKSPKRSLGWVPFKAVNVSYKAGQIKFSGHLFSLWDSYGMGGYKMHAGSFSEDSRGRWYFNVAVEVLQRPSTGTAAVGIDLGLKTAVTTSTGIKFDGRLYRASENALSRAQRAGKKRRAKAIHAKIKNQRKDGLHKLSTALVRENAAIFVGDVSSAKLIKTKMAKSTLDAGWSQFKTMLEYKANQAGIIFMEVNEAHSTQTCSQCGSIEGPAGLNGLGVRGWVCSCGAAHERDINAARNILRVGLDSLGVGAGAHGHDPKPSEQPIGVGRFLSAPSTSSASSGKGDV